MNIYKIYFFTVVTILFGTQYLVSSKETWEKIKANGYPLKMYEYMSEDRFMLGMERIPYSKYGNKTIGKPVILLSGMFATSIVYVSHNKSLGFLLSDAGFDVWLFNYRVTGMSKKIKDPRTGIIPKLTSLNWDYSFHELAIYDLPAAIDLVLSVTGHSKVDVGGVSLGATIPLITLAEKPEYNKKVRNLVLMAPATRMGSGYQGIQYYFIRKAIRTFLKAKFKFNYISLNSDPDNIAVGQLCRIKFFGFICVQSMNLIQGFYNPLHIEPVIDVFTTYPQPTSLKSVKHYFQLLLSGRFSNYDYGTVGNLAHYNSITVPEYNISKITAPAIILYSKRDNLVPPKDIKWLLDNLPNVKDKLYIDNIPFSHQSFVMGKNSHLVVAPYIVKQLSKNY
ncbi:lipase 3-like [Sipha flava]|uniref:Lipase n=1 Tax=Sipha flava TaxID=143950 RepID=A0A8B8FUW4_9HEMI|nr:lipase 3-like [Sipha flava]